MDHPAGADSPRAHGSAHEPDGVRSRRGLRRLCGCGPAAQHVGHDGQQPRAGPGEPARRPPVEPDDAQGQPDRGRLGLFPALHADPGRDRGGRRRRQRAAIDLARPAAALHRHAYRAVRGPGRRRVPRRPSAAVDRPDHGRADDRSGRGGLRSGDPGDTAAGLEPDRPQPRTMAARAVLQPRLPQAAPGTGPAGRPHAAQLPALRLLSVRRRVAVQRSRGRRAGRARRRQSDQQQCRDVASRGPQRPGPVPGTQLRRGRGSADGAAGAAARGLSPGGVRDQRGLSAPPPAVGQGAGLHRSAGRAHGGPSGLDGPWRPA